MTATAARSINCSCKGHSGFPRPTLKSVGDIKTNRTSSGSWENTLLPLMIGPRRSNLQSRRNQRNLGSVEIAFAFGPFSGVFKATTPAQPYCCCCCWNVSRRGGRQEQEQGQARLARPKSDEAKEVEEREGAASKEKGGRQTTRSECGTAQTIFAVRILENRWRLMNMMRCRSHAPEVQTGKAKGRHGALEFGTHHQGSFAC